MSLYSWSVHGNRWMSVKPGNVWAWSVQGNRWMRIVSMKSWSASGNRWYEIFPDPTITDMYDRSGWEKVRGRDTGGDLSGSGGVVWGGTVVKKAYGINNMIRRLTGIKVQYRVVDRGTANTLKFQISTTEGMQGTLTSASWGNGVFSGWIDVNTTTPLFELHVTNIGSNSGDGVVTSDVMPIEFRFAD